MRRIRAYEREANGTVFFALDLRRIIGQQGQGIVRPPFAVFQFLVQLCVTAFRFLVALGVLVVRIYTKLWSRFRRNPSIELLPDAYRPLLSPNMQTCINSRILHAAYNQPYISFRLVYFVRC